MGGYQKTFWFIFWRCQKQGRLGILSARKTSSDDQPVPIRGEAIRREGPAIFWPGCGVTSSLVQSSVDAHRCLHGNRFAQGGPREGLEGEAWSCTCHITHCSHALHEGSLDLGFLIGCHGGTHGYPVTLRNHLKWLDELSMVKKICGMILQFSSIFFRISRPWAWLYQDTLPGELPEEAWGNGNFKCHTRWDPKKGHVHWWRWFMIHDRLW